MADSSFDVAVVGGGIAGLTAAHHAALGGVSVGHFAEPELLGGLVVNVGALDGYPAAGTPSGVELAVGLTEANAGLGVNSIASRIDAIESAGAMKVLRGAGAVWRARQVIVATGARLKPLAVPGAERLTGRGVSQCAWCDGALYRDADVVVAGGGDAALSEALHLAQFARSITIITRGETFRARQHYVTRAAEDERFQFRWGCEITEVLGDSVVDGVRIREHGSNTDEVLACTGLFVFVGLEPSAGLLDTTVGRDQRGFLRTDDRLETSMPGVLAIGAVRAGYGGRLTNAVSEATMAGELAARRCTAG
jgi:thioredoxin reductase (NADPH)